MAAKHPYTSGTSPVTAMIAQLRKAFPQNVTSDTLKKLGLAPNNESYVINALQFVGVLDEEGKKTENAAKIFSMHKDEDFAKAFEKEVKSAYSDLFDLHGDDAWSKDKVDLITFFRHSDQTSAIIGGRQASLFLAFAALAGHGEIAQPKSSPAPQAAKSATTKTTKKKNAADKPNSKSSGGLASEETSSDSFGLSVKIEVNLPANADPETYDAIFASIRKNLMTK